MKMANSLSLIPDQLKTAGKNYQSKRMYEIHPSCRDVSQSAHGEWLQYEGKRALMEENVHLCEMVFKKEPSSGHFEIEYIHVGTSNSEEGLFWKSHSD